MLWKKSTLPGLAVVLSALLLVSLTLSGCGGNSASSGGSGGNSNPVSVTVLATPTTVDGGDAVTLSATVANDSGSAGVTWSTPSIGTLSGQTTSAATFTAPAATSTQQTVTITATSKTDSTKSNTATLTIAAAPSITPTTLPAGMVGTAYSVTLVGAGGIAPYTFSATAGEIPPGLTLNAATGVLSGVPTAAGSDSSFSVQITDSGKATPQVVVQSLGALIISQPPVIVFNNNVPATGTVGTAYAGTIAATGGAGTITYSLASGSAALPTGLTLNATTGTITGSPTTAGTFPFTVKATDAYGDTATQPYSVKIAAAVPTLAVTAATLPTGYVNAVYTSTSLAATGGVAPYSWAVTNGTALPTGLTLSSVGVLSGTPTATTPASFSVTVTDSASTTATGTFSITIAPALSVTTTTLPAGYAGTTYAGATLTATGGSGTGYVWSAASGYGLTLSSAGLLSGTPTAAGTASFTAKVTDSAGNTATKAFTVQVYNPLALQAQTTLTPTVTGQTYVGSIVATGGIAPYSWTVATLSDGLTSNATTATTSTLTLGGTVGATHGPISFLVTVKDSANNSVANTYTIQINAPGAVISLPSGVDLGNALVGVGFTANAGVMAPGSGAPYYWTINGVSIPGNGTVTQLTNGFSAFGPGGASFELLGTPTAPGAFYLNVTVVDSNGDKANGTYTINVSAASDTTNNAHLNGQYVCKLSGFATGDATRWATLVSVKADGAGNLTNGVFDSNATDLTSALTGTTTGSYSVGADNNGLLTFINTPTVGTQTTSQWAIALTGASPAAGFSLVEVDDAGNNPSGHSGTGDCSLATPLAFAASTINGNSFVFQLTGETSTGSPSSSVGRFTAPSTPGNTVSSGSVDSAAGAPAVVTSNTFSSGSFSAPATTGRLTLALPIGASAATENLVAYIVDANRAFLLQTDSASGTSSGLLRTQKQATYSNTNLTGNFVVYEEGNYYASGSLPGYYVGLIEATGGTPSGNNFTVNQSLENIAGTFENDNANGATSVTFDASNLGRVTYTAGTDTGTTFGASAGYWYLYDTNSALTLNVVTTGGIQTGELLPQTQSTFTNAALAGTYALGQLPELSTSSTAYAGVFSVVSNGTTTATVTEAGKNFLDWQLPETGSTYTWVSPTYGDFTLTDASSNHYGCIVISATKFACINEIGKSSYVQIFQQ